MSRNSPQRYPLNLFNCFIPDYSIGSFSHRSIHRIKVLHVSWSIESNHDDTAHSHRYRPMLNSTHTRNSSMPPPLVASFKSLYYASEFVAPKVLHYLRYTHFSRMNRIRPCRYIRAVRVCCWHVLYFDLLKATRKYMGAELARVATLSDHN